LSLPAAAGESVKNAVPEFAIPRRDVLRHVQEDVPPKMKVTCCHPEPRMRSRRGTSHLVARYPNLCEQSARERSLAYARDDGRFGVL